MSWIAPVLLRVWCRYTYSAALASASLPGTARAQATAAIESVHNEMAIAKRLTVLSLALDPAAHFRVFSWLGEIYAAACTQSVRWRTIFRRWR
jgi:hypothetical protein